VDVQVNGYAGADLGADADGWAHVARALAAEGVTAFCPTLVTRSDRGYARAARTLASARWPRNGARNAGVHLEGPFLAPARPGAHPPGAIRDPTPEAVDRLLAAFAPRIVTLAPERPGAVAAIRRMSRRGVVVAAGHTEADARQAAAAIAAGARLLTHALNAMRAISSRDPSALVAFLADRRTRVSLIADGVHVAPEVAALLARIAGPRLLLISDAVSAAGAPPGRYRLGDRAIRSDGARSTAGGRLAGSTTPLWAGPGVLVEAGLRRNAALAAASVAPRRLLGLPLGAPGDPADLVVLDEEGRPRLTLIDGRVAWADRGLPFDVPRVGRPFAA
jgi:N-acetylglucosamine-6-phosphate deacetylase